MYAILQIGVSCIHLRFGLQKNKFLSNHVVIINFKINFYYKYIHVYTM